MSLTGFVQYSLSRRDDNISIQSCGIIFDSYFQPFVERGGTHCFDEFLNPCAPPFAFYVLHPNTMPPPQGFHWFGLARPISLPVDIWATQYNMPTEPSIISSDVVSLTAPQQAALPQSQKGKEGKLPVDPKEVIATTEDPDELEEDVITLRAGYDGYYLISSKNGRRTQATNFLLQKQSIDHFVKVNQAEEELKLVVRVTVFCVPQVQEVISIPFADLGTLITLVSKTYPPAITYSKAKTSFLSQFPEFFREDMSAVPHKYLYKSSGWHTMPNGALAYVQDGTTPPTKDVEFKCGFAFCPPNVRYLPQEALDYAMRLLDMSSPPVNVLIPFLFAHLGCLWELFSMAGYPPHVLLFIQGVSGSLKTAVASVIFNFTASKDDAIPATFRDTSASMEVKMDKYKDRVLLVDDFCPGATSMSKNQLQQTLEQIVRFYGDGIGKARTNPKLEETFEKKPHGLCAITGEDTTGSYSSQLRCLFLEVEKGSFRSDILSEFQANPTRWTGHLRNFVVACESNPEAIISLIATLFPEYRQNGAQHLKERRLIDTFSWLAITARIFTDYMKQVHPTLPGTERERLYQSMERMVLETCQKSERAAAESDPALTFTTILLNALSQREVKLGTVEEFSANPDKFIGAEHQGYWYLWPSQAYKLVLSTYRSVNKTFPLSEKALWQQLANANILHPSLQKSKGVDRLEYGTRVSFGGRPRLLKISPAALHDLDSK